MPYEEQRTQLHIGRQVTTTQWRRILSLPKVEVTDIREEVYACFTVPQLKEALRSYGASLSGLKPDLIRRLVRLHSMTPQGASAAMWAARVLGTEPTVQDLANDAAVVRWIGQACLNSQLSGARSTRPHQA